MPAYVHPEPVAPKRYLFWARVYLYSLRLWLPAFVLLLILGLAGADDSPAGEIATAVGFPSFCAWVLASIVVKLYYPDT